MFRYMTTAYKPVNPDEQLKMNYKSESLRNSSWTRLLKQAKPIFNPKAPIQYEPLCTRTTVLTGRSWSPSQPPGTTAWRGMWRSKNTSSLGVGLVAILVVGILGEPVIHYKNLCLICFWIVIHRLYSCILPNVFITHDPGYLWLY